MKKSARLMAIVMTAVMLLGTAGCTDTGSGKSGKGKDKDSKDNGEKIEELQKLEGDMFVLESYIRAPIPDDMDPTTEYRVTYAGYVYSDRGYADEVAKMSDEDYMELYEFCKTAIKTNKYAGYYEEVCDGQTYMFMYYDEDGNEQLIYDGYCYDNDDLDSIVDLVTGYTIEECPVE